MLQLGRCRASQLSSLVGVPRPQIYEILRELSSKGIIQRTPGSPTIYTAIPPENALSLLTSRLTQRLNLLKYREAKLATDLTKFRDSKQSIDTHVDLITGGGNALHRQLHLLQNVRYDYASISSKDGLKRLGGQGILGEEFLQAVKRARRRGVRIRIISDVVPSNRKSAAYLSTRAELRRLPDLMIYLSIFDQQDMLIGPSLSDDETGESDSRQTDLWTNNPKFVRGMYEVFDRLWSEASEYRRKRQGRD
jgi:sugar-specific transcriptional regulator TrmB